MEAYTTTADRSRIVLRVRTTSEEVKPGDVVTDPDGSQWRIISVYSSGVSRVRVGSLAETVNFPEPK